MDKVVAVAITPLWVTCATGWAFFVALQWPIMEAVKRV